MNNFAQLDGETLYEAWERFKELIRKCPHHGIEKWMLVHNFYNGLMGNTRTLNDAATGGDFMRKSANDAYNLFEVMTLNDQQWLNARNGMSRVARVNEVDIISKMAAQMELMNRKLEGISLHSLVNQINQHC